MNRYEVMMVSGAIYTTHATSKAKAVMQVEALPAALRIKDKAQAFRIIK